MAQPAILCGWPVGSGEIAGTIVSRRVILGSILMLIITGGSVAQTANQEPTVTDLQRQIQAMRSQIAKIQNRIAELETARGIAATSSGPDPALLQSENPPTQALQSQPGDTKSSEEPTSFHYKGLTLTPGGFLEGTMLLRTRNENADIANKYSAVPLNGSSNAKLSEFRGSARNSELSLLVQGTAGSTKLKGYVEADFLGAAPTANYVSETAFHTQIGPRFGENCTSKAAHTIPFLARQSPTTHSSRPHHYILQRSRRAMCSKECRGCSTDPFGDLLRHSEDLLCVIVGPQMEITKPPASTSE
jgi:hypothetical protein